MNKGIKLFLAIGLTISSLTACNSAKQNQEAETNTDVVTEDTLPDIEPSISEDDMVAPETARERDYKERILKKGKTKEELHIAGYSAFYTEGDLNKDGFNDLVIMEIGEDPELIEDPDNFPIDNNPVELRIYFGDANGEYTLFKHYPKSIGASEYGQPLYISITDKGALRFERKNFDYKAADEHGHATHLFRFQDGDFYCIGLEEEDFGRFGEGEKVSVNYLTRKKITTPIRDFNHISKEAKTESFTMDSLYTLDKVFM